jgi:hypothetical protein
MNRQRLVSIMVVLAFVVFAVPAAMAGGPNDDQYPTSTTLVKKSKPKIVVAGTKAAQATAPHKTAPLTTVKSTGTLPFTGFDLAFVAVVGGAAVAGGLGLRKLGRKRTNGV